MRSLLYALARLLDDVGAVGRAGSFGGRATGPSGAPWGASGGRLTTALLRESTAIRKRRLRRHFRQRSGCDRGRAGSRLIA